MEEVGNPTLKKSQEQGERKKEFKRAIGGGLPCGVRKDTDSQDLALERLGVDGLPGGLKQLPQPVYPH